MWLNPLPAETVIGAIVGAVLSTILAQYGYFGVESWIEARFALYFTFLILAFGISLHFYCAAVLLEKRTVARIFRLTAILILIIVLIGYAKRAQVGSDGSVLFLPNPGNSLICGVLLIWLLMVRSLTAFKKWVGE
jgi:hypothetical protein